MLSLRELSMLLRMLELLLRRLALRASSGSWGFKPLARAKRLSMSVRLTTPLRRPDRLAPGMAFAEMAGAAVPARSGECAVTPAEAAAGSGTLGAGKDITVGFTDGVGGPEDAGEGASTIHIRWERVATSLATVCARVE